MDLTPLQIFLAIAEEGHLTRAAARVGRSQPAVSAQLANLEEELGQRLFDRTPLGMRLTPAGALLRPYVLEATAALRAGREALDALNGLERGTVSIGGGATATRWLLPPFVGAFLAAHPGVRLFVREQGSAEVIDDVRAGALDLGIVTAGGEADRLVVEPWVRDELVLVLPPGHPLAGQAHFHWEALRGARLVMFSAGAAVRAPLDAGLAGRDAVVVMELRSIEAILAMVAAGVGAGFVSRHALPPDTAGLPCADGPIYRDLCLVWRADRTLSPAARAFRERLRSAGEALGAAAP